MKKYKILVCLLIVSCTLSAQSWELHVATGFSYANIIPSGNASRPSDLIHYGFRRPGLYISPELDFKLDEHSRLSLGYQLSGNKVGMQIRPGGRFNAAEYMANGISLHNFSVGYSYSSPVGKGRWTVGGFAKLGVAYGQMTSISMGGGSGHFDNGGFYLAGSSITSFEVMPDFWAPTSTVGFVTGPVAKGRRLADRLSFTLSATMVWKNPYVSPSLIHYSAINASTAQEGIARLEGMPLQLQFGLDYSLFRFGRKSNPQK
jgi:hypothetical protein